MMLIGRSLYKFKTDPAIDFEGAPRGIFLRYPDDLTSIAGPTLDSPVNLASNSGPPLKQVRLYKVLSRLGRSEDSKEKALPKCSAAKPQVRNRTPLEPQM